MANLSPSTRAHFRAKLITQIQNGQEKRQDLRSRERSLGTRKKLLDMEPVVSNEGDLRENLLKILPNYMVPTNVGNLHQILQPFDYSVEFNDIGIDPTFSPATNFRESFQVTQEAGFILTSINRNYMSLSNAGLKAPLDITIRDNQSTRQFMDRPIPIQQIADKGQATELNAVYLFMPNASVEVNLTSWIPNNWAVIGDGYQQFTFGGYRIPISDAEYVARSILL